MRNGPSFRLVEELPVWITVRGIRYEIRLNQGQKSCPSYLGAHEDGHAGYWPIALSLPNDLGRATAILRDGIPVPVWGAELMVEICRQLVRDRIFEVCKDPNTEQE